MFQVERRKLIAAPPDVVKAALADLEQMQRLFPQAERVEVRGATAERARVTVTVRVGRLGTQHIDGEARILSNGVRFVAVRPIQIDSRWTVEARGDQSEVTASLTIELGGPLAALGRLAPHALVERRIGRELDEALDTLARTVQS
jgi:carbon monoxide dehydrogenase subunit G